MKTKNIIALLLVACLPIALLAWLGVRLARDERSMVTHQVRELLQGQLQETDQSITRFFESMRVELLRLTELPSLQPDRLRQIVRNEPRVSQLLLLDAEGEVLHPPLGEPLNDGEREFIARAKPYLLDKDLIRAADAAPGQASKHSDLKRSRQVSPASQPSQAGPTRRPNDGWYVWYWGRGLNLVFWRRLDNGHVIGVELNRSRWLAELIVHLPKTRRREGDETEWQIRLLDSNSQTVYQWGAYDDPDDPTPFVELPVSAPLSSWRLHYFVANSRFTALAGRSVYFNLLAGITVASAGLIALMFYVYRETSRDLREATTRVNFVNQVSHELKTPLTNIRLYAELLGGDLQDLPPEETEQTRTRLEVIIAESTRLSRLIGNVLSFASQQRQQVAIRPKPGCVDELVSSVIQQFEPAMRRKGIHVKLEQGAPRQVSLDADFVEQILVNLLSNVEKYAAAGELLHVKTSQDGNQSTIVVSDRGPGVPEAEAERIFQPFYRLESDLEGATGAGIGLAISRNLARLHGGDVILLPSECGAVVEVSLQTRSV